MRGFPRHFIGTTPRDSIPSLLRTGRRRRRRRKNHDGTVCLHHRLVFFLLLLSASTIFHVAVYLNFFLIFLFFPTLQCVVRRDWIGFISRQIPPKNRKKNKKQKGEQDKKEKKNMFDRTPHKTLTRANHESFSS